MGKEIDRIVMQAAVKMSRRGFFKKLGGLGLGTGLGLAGIGQALACDPCTTKSCGGPCNKDCTYCVVTSGGTSIRYHVCHNSCGLTCTNTPPNCH